MHSMSVKIKIDGEVVHLYRINKTKARKLYDSGDVVFVLACKLYPCRHGMGYPWQCKMHDYPNIDKVRFDSKISNYIWYNCNWETGYYPAYYKGNKVLHNLSEDAND